MNKKKKIIIITITSVIVIIAGIIVGISVNKHNTAVKEALSVSESKEYVCNSFDDEYKSIVDKKYKTAEEYKSAKDNLIALKDKINISDIKEDERLVIIVSNIDETIEEYDAKIKDLTTTVTETTTESTTEKETEKQVNATTRKSGSSNNTDTNSNKSKNPTKDTPKENTKAKTTAKSTTTKKSSKPKPKYGTITENPLSYDCDWSGWSTGKVEYTWNGSIWECEIYFINMSSSKENEYEKYALSYFKEPNRKGKYNGEIVSKEICVWLNK